MPSLAGFCRENEIRQGYIPMFLAEADIVGTCEKLEDPAGTGMDEGACNERRSPGVRMIPRDDADGILPYVHIAVGLKEHSATARASHLLPARVQVSPRCSSSRSSRLE
jgi:hypothetical protein